MSIAAISITSCLCCKHIEEKFILHGKKSNLKLVINPIPTIHSDEVLK